MYRTDRRHKIIPISFKKKHCISARNILYSKFSGFETRGFYKGGAGVCGAPTPILPLRHKILN